jgi:hypothetical protein
LINLWSTPWSTLINPWATTWSTFIILDHPWWIPWSTLNNPWSTTWSTLFETLIQTWLILWCETAKTFVCLTFYDLDSLETRMNLDLHIPRQNKKPILLGSPQSEAVHATTNQDLS